MKNTILPILIASASAFSGTAIADTTSAEDILNNIDSSNWAVNPEDFGMTVKEYIRAEHHSFANDFVGRVGINTFHHFTTLAKKEDHWVVSPSLDHLYSIAVVDARKGFTIVLPENIDNRFVSLHIQDENHTFVAYEVAAGTYTYTAEQVDTDTVIVGIRMASDGSSENLEHIVNELQPQYKIIANSAIEDVPSVAQEGLLKVRDALMTEYDKLPDTYGTVTYNIEDVTDWEKLSYTLAGAWGLSPEDTAMYPAYNLKDVQGGTCYQAQYPAVPVRLEDGGYFSITVYGPDKYLMADHDNIVSSNHAKTIFNKDGSFDVIFGGEQCRSIDKKTRRELCVYTRQ